MKRPCKRSRPDAAAAVWQHELSNQLQDALKIQRELELELTQRKERLEDANMTEQQLRTQVEELAKRHDPAVLMKRALGRMMRATVVSAMEMWMAHTAERKANRSIMKRVVAMYSANTQLFALEAWVSYHHDVKAKQAELVAQEELRLREEQLRRQQEEEAKQLQEEEGEGSDGGLESRYGDAGLHPDEAGPAGVRAQVQEELLQETRLELDLLRSSVSMCLSTARSPAAAAPAPARAPLLVGEAPDLMCASCCCSIAKPWRSCTRPKPSTARCRSRGACCRPILMLARRC